MIINVRDLGDQEEGFFQVLELLQEAKLGKWSLLTILPFYNSPQEEIFVKPITTKKIIDFFELKLMYHPTPSYAFYQQYKKIQKNPLLVMR